MVSNISFVSSWLYGGMVGLWEDETDIDLILTRKVRLGIFGNWLLDGADLFTSAFHVYCTRRQQQRTGW